VTNAIDSSGLYKELGLTKAPEEVTPRKTKLGQDDFMALLTTQLKNQDPMKPMENTDFIAQMAQFSSVDGITKLNQSFEGLSSSITSNQALQASSLIGRDVLVKDQTSLYNGLDAVRGQVMLDRGAPNFRVQIEDANGALVNTIDMGNQAEGPVDIQWNGLDANGNPLPPGIYTIKAETQANGQNQAVPVKLFQRVESVTVGNGTQGLSLNLAGVGPRPFTEVETIE